MLFLFFVHGPVTLMFVIHRIRPTPKKLPALGKDQVPAQSEIMNTNREVRISVRAYEIYEERIRMGAPLQDWLRAEQEIMTMMEYEG